MSPIYLAYAVVCFWAPLPDESLPRYRLTPGRELSWQSENCLKYGKGPVKNEQRDSARWTAWVIRTNPDGSARLLIRSECRSFGTNGGEPIPESSRTQIAYVDVFPDGRFKCNTSTEDWDPVTAILPRLPKVQRKRERDGRAGLRE